jgi:hypothetical protein
MSQWQKVPSTAALEVKSQKSKVKSQKSKVKSQKSKVKSQKTYILGFCAIWNGMFICAMLY